jgi:histone H4
MSTKGKGGSKCKGLGAAGPKKHRVVEKDAVVSSTPGIMRIAKAGGSPKTTKLAIQELKTHMESMIEKIIKDAVTITEHSRKKTISSSAIKYAYEIVYREKYYGTPPSEGCGKTKKYKKKSKGTLAKEVIHYQIQTDCFLLQKAPFRGYVRKIVDELHISKEAFLVLQDIVEHSTKLLVDVCVKLMIHRKAQILSARDVSLARQILGHRTPLFP